MKSLNLQKIQKNIRAKHKDFKNSVGYMPEKINADQQLDVATVLTRVSAILQCFVKEKIIDSFAPMNKRSINDGFVLKKEDAIGVMRIYTDGHEIKLIKYKEMTNDRSFPSVDTALDVDEDDFNWEEFADLLLDRIHEIMYHRSKSFELKIWGDNK